jgi:hypothetical protein
VSDWHGGRGESGWSRNLRKLHSSCNARHAARTHTDCRASQQNAEFDAGEVGFVFQ